MYLAPKFKLSLSATVLSLTCLGLLTSCGAVDSYRNAMPSGYAHQTAQPLAQPRMTHPHDKKVTYDQAHIQHVVIKHQDKADQLLEQMTPSLRTISAQDSLFLVSEQKNRDFDDALRFGLRNLGLDLDLSSMARYQLIYTMRPAEVKDFEFMSIMPSKDEIKTLEYYALSLVDTTYGSPIARAYLIPTYHGFPVPQNMMASPVENQGHEATMVIEPITAEEPIDMPSYKAQPVLDDSPMLAPMDENSIPPSVEIYDTSTPTIQNENVSYGSVYTPENASNAPLAITDSNTNVKDITAQ
jgi:hypothetical protein